MNLYQTGALTEAQCAMIAGALTLLAHSTDVSPVDTAEAVGLAEMFQNPKTHLIQVDE